METFMEYEHKRCSFFVQGQISKLRFICPVDSAFLVSMIMMVVLTMIHVYSLDGSSPALVYSGLSLAFV